MSDQHVHPYPHPQQTEAVPPVVAAPSAGVPAQAVDAQNAWIDGYEPGNPWQAKLCLQTPYGTVAYPLTPHTMPELLEGLVMVAQEQQGATGGSVAAESELGGTGGERPEPARNPSVHDGRAARLTGWALVHDLWERDDPRVRFIMGAVVVGLLILGIFLT
ncbi:hypothetical protein [Streptomyces sp. cmx-18-6]|uniref:hypothetical protein n=1 Tax=Streptomyces sp. cmx-18-6 TaxID=2790930 RepID=UPI00398087A3